LLLLFLDKFKSYFISGFEQIILPLFSILIDFSVSVFYFTILDYEKSYLLTINILKAGLENKTKRCRGFFI